MAKKAVTYGDLYRSLNKLNSGESPLDNSQENILKIVLDKIKAISENYTNTPIPEEWRRYYNTLKRGKSLTPEQWLTFVNKVLVKIPVTYGDLFKLLNDSKEKTSSLDKSTIDNFNYIFSQVETISSTQANNSISNELNQYYIGLRQSNGLNSGQWSNFADEVKKVADKIANAASGQENTEEHPSEVPTEANSASDGKVRRRLKFVVWLTEHKDFIIVIVVFIVGWIITVCKNQTESIDFTYFALESIKDAVGGFSVGGTVRALSERKASDLESANKNKHFGVFMFACGCVFAVAFFAGNFFPIFIVAGWYIIDYIWCTAVLILLLLFGALLIIWSEEDLKRLSTTTTDGVVAVKDRTDTVGGNNMVDNDTDKTSMVKSTTPDSANTSQHTEIDNAASVNGNGN